MRLYLNHLRHSRPEMLSKCDGVNGNVLIDPSAIIGQGCKIGPDVTIAANVIVKDGVSLKNCTVLKGTKINSHAWISNAIIGWKSVIGKWVRIEGISVLGEDVIVQDEIYINGGHVLPHKSIANSVPEPQIIM